MPSSDEFVEFLTGPVYEIVTTMVGKEQVAAQARTSQHPGSLYWRDGSGRHAGIPFHEGDSP